MNWKKKKKNFLFLPLGSEITIVEEAAINADRISADLTESV